MHITDGIQTTVQITAKALQRYEREMRPPPRPRSYDSVEHLARLRGGNVGTRYAEAFVPVRQKL